MSKIRVFPFQARRVETGLVRFGDDWPGLFIRGDDARGMLEALSRVVNDPAIIDAAILQVDLAPLVRLMKLLEETWI